MEAKTKGSVAIGLSVIIFSSIVMSYWDRFGLFYMTFWSNTLAGIILLAGGIALLCGRDIPEWLYLDSAALLGMVIFVCGRFGAAECFGNATVVLHIVNPCFVMIFFIVCCGEVHWKFLPTVLVFPNIYYAFMVIYGKVTGDAVYTAFDPNALGGWRVILYGIAACALLAAIAAVLMLINKAVRKKMNGVFGSARVDGVIQNEVKLNGGNEKVRYG